MAEGWIKLHRKSFENFLYTENRPHTRREAWEDILVYVNYKDSSMLIGNKKIECKRGQSLMSLESWGKIFNWDKSRVRRFFDLLNAEQMIVVENVKKSTRITVCNYEDYQGDRNTNETHLTLERNAFDTQTTPIEERKEEKEYISVEFEKFRQLFPGTKRGFIVEFENFTKKNNGRTVDLLMPALKREIEHRKKLKDANEFVPQWKNLSTWINQKCWTQEFPEMKKHKSEEKLLQKPY